MIFGHCLLCASMEIGYQNGLLSVKVPGLQVDFSLCLKHSQIARHPNKWSKINRDLWTETSEELVRLEEAYLQGKELSEETCLLCLGFGQLELQGQCWWCKGKGVVKPELLPSRAKLLAGVSLN